MSTAREMDKGKAKPITWQGAPRGLIKNAPHDDLPAGSVAGLTNAHSFPTEFQPRLGTEIFSELSLPRQRSGLEAYKTDNRIIAPGGTFSAADVGRYWVWPDTNTHDEIQQYISDSEVRTDSSGDRASTLHCWVHERLNLWGFHKTTRQHVMLWGPEVWVYDTLMTTKTKAVCVSYEHPVSSVSSWDEQDEYGVIFNTNGVYLVDFKGIGTSPVVFRRNSPVPTVLLDGEPRDDFKRIRHDYIYAMVRIAGNGIRSRTVSGAKIIQQSGSTAIQEVGVDQERDYGTMWMEKKIDDGTKYCGKLTGALLAAAYTAPTYWNGIAAPGVSIGITINDRTENFVVDMGPAGYDVSSMAEVAAAFQETIRLVFYKATWEYRDGRFIVTSGEENESTIGFATAGVGGTSVATIAGLNAAAGATIDNAFVYAVPNVVSVLTMPIADGSTSDVARHWTHYAVLRTENIGPDGVYPRINEKTNEELPPVNFTWVADARCAGAFYASKNHDGLVTAAKGEFEPADVGTPFKWADGDVETIEEYVDSTHVYTTSGYGYEYYEDSKPLQAACIGGGKLITAIQSGTMVYASDGDSFSAGDVGSTLWTADGEELLITDFINDHHVTVSSSDNKIIQGMTWQPVSRAFNDTVNDGILLSRQGEAHIGLWEHRFWKQMVSGACGVIVPGFLISAKRNSSKIYYSQLPIGRKYMGGYHLTTRQVNDRVEDSIQVIAKQPNRVIVFCKNSTWGGATNLSDSNIKQLPEFGYSYAVLYFDILDDRIGLIDYGSLRSVDRGTFIMRCSDGSVRQFDGTKYGEDLTMDPESRQDRIKATLGEAWPLSVSAYSDKENMGYILWLKQK